MESRERDVEMGDQSSSSHSRYSLHHGKNKGGWKAIKFILANETFEKLASMSLIVNITLYLRTKYNMDGILLINVVNIWSGSSNTLSLPGAILSDAYLGRFYTLLIGSIASMLGMGTMTLGAWLPKLRPPSCDPESYCIAPKSWQLAILFIALLLLAIGSGCIRPCNIAFGADQFDTTTEKGRSQLSRFYNWWYFSFTISLLVALTAVVYVQTNVSWAIGFAIPTACFALSILVFLLGCHTYIYKTPQGSIFIDMVKVVVAAYRKRKENVTNFVKDDFYDPPVDDESKTMVAKLYRSDRLQFFDKAAIILSRTNELDDNDIAIDNWRLCSVQQVEQLKCLIGILPVWVAGILCFMTMDQQNTFGILQAMQMNRNVGSHFVIPPAWIGLTGMVALSIWIVIYERGIIPLLNKLKRTNNARLSLKTRINIGIIISICCMCMGSMIENKRRKAAVKAGTFESPISVGFLMPQLALSGLTEAFAAVSIMEFFATQMPEQMRSLGGSIFFICLSMASYLSTIVVNIIYITTKRQDGVAWLGGHDLNSNRLDYFYGIIACIGVFNFFYFTCFASKYVLVGDETNMKTREESLDAQAYQTSVVTGI